MRRHVSPLLFKRQYHNVMDINLKMIWIDYKYYITLMLITYKCDMGHLYFCSAHKVLSDKTTSRSAAASSRFLKYMHLQTESGLDCKSNENHNVRKIYFNISPTLCSLRCHSKPKTSESVSTMQILAAICSESGGTGTINSDQVGGRRWSEFKQTKTCVSASLWAQTLFTFIRLAKVKVVREFWFYQSSLFSSFL